MNKRSISVLSVLIVLIAVPGWSQTCQSREEIAAADRTAIENTAQQLFEQSARGDADSIRTNSVPSLQSSFNGIAGAVNDNKDALSGAKPQIRTAFLLDTGATPSPDGRFYCGVYSGNGMASNGAEFDLPGLAAGKYAVVIQDVVGSKGPYAFSTVLQQMNGWKLAGLQIRPESAYGHDGIWYLERARDYKNKGQNHNAWFFYATSWDLMAPVRFMETKLLGKINEELTSVQPKDIPSGNPVSYIVNGKTYSITEMSVLHTQNTFDLAIKYSVPSTADFNATQADARNLANAYVAQYPELKDAFNNVWAHAIDPSGGDVPGLVNLEQATN